MKTLLARLPEKALSSILIMSLLTPVALLPGAPHAQADGAAPEAALQTYLHKLNSSAWSQVFDQVTASIANLREASTAFSASGAAEGRNLLASRTTEAEQALLALKRLLESELARVNPRDGSRSHDLLLVLFHDYHRLLSVLLEAQELVSTTHDRERGRTSSVFDGARLDARFRITLSTDKALSLLEESSDSPIADINVVAVPGRRGFSTLELESQALFSLVQDRLVGTPSESLIRDHFRIAAGQIVAMELASLNSFLYPETRVRVEANEFPGRDGAFLSSFVAENAEAHFETSFRSLNIERLYELSKPVFGHRQPGYRAKLVAFYTSLAREYAWALEPRKLYARSTAFAGFTGGQIGLQFTEPRTSGSDRSRSQAEEYETRYFKQVFSHYPEHLSKSNAESLRDKLLRIVLEAETQSLMAHFSCSLFKDTAEGRGRLENGKPVRSECERGAEENAIFVESELFAKANDWTETKKGLLRDRIRSFVARSLNAGALNTSHLSHILGQRSHATQLLVSKARYDRASEMMEAARIINHLSQMKRQLSSPEVGRPGTQNSVQAGLLPITIQPGYLIDSYDESLMSTDQALTQIDGTASYVLNSPWMGEATRNILTELDAAEATERSAARIQEPVKTTAEELRADLVGILRRRVSGARERITTINSVITRGNPALLAELRNVPNRLRYRSVPFVSAAFRLMSSLRVAIGNLALWSNDSVFDSIDRSQDSEMSRGTRAIVRIHREAFESVASNEPVVAANHENVMQIVRLNDRLMNDPFYRNAGSIERVRKQLAADSSREAQIGSGARTILRGLVELDEYLADQKLSLLQSELASAIDRLFVKDVFPLFRIQLQTEFFRTDYLNPERLEILHAAQHNRGEARSAALSRWLMQDQNVFSLYVDRHIRLLQERYPGLNFKIALPTPELRALVANDSDIYFWEYLVAIDKLLKNDPAMIDRILGAVSGLRQTAAQGLNANVLAFPLQEMVSVDRLTLADRRSWLERATYGILASLAFSSIEPHRAVNSPRFWPQSVKARDLYGAYGAQDSLNHSHAWLLSLPISCRKYRADDEKRQCFRSHIAASVLGSALLQVPLMSAAQRSKTTLQRISSNHQEWEELVFYSEAFSRLRSLYSDSLGGGLNRLERRATATTRYLEAIKTSWGEVNHGIFSAFLWNFAVPFGRVAEGILHAVMWPGMALDVTFNVAHFRHAIQVYSSLSPYAHSTFLTSGLLSSMSVREIQDRIQMDAEVLWNRLWMDALWTQGMIRGRIQQPQMTRESGIFNSYFSENGLDRFSAGYKALLERGASPAERVAYIDQIVESLSSSGVRRQAPIRDIFAVNQYRNQASRERNSGESELENRRSSEAEANREIEPETEGSRGPRMPQNSRLTARINPETARNVLRQTALTIEMNHNYTLFTQELQLRLKDRTPVQVQTWIRRSMERLRETTGEELADAFRTVLHPDSTRDNPIYVRVSIEEAARESLRSALVNEVAIRLIRRENLDDPSHFLNRWRALSEFESIFAERPTVESISQNPESYIGAAEVLFGRDADTIKRRYRELARELHPDRNPELRGDDYLFVLMKELHKIAVSNATRASEDLSAVAHGRNRSWSTGESAPVESPRLPPLLNAENPREE